MKWWWGNLWQGRVQTPFAFFFLSSQTQKVRCHLPACICTQSTLDIEGQHHPHPLTHPPTPSQGYTVGSSTRKCEYAYVFCCCWKAVCEGWGGGRTRQQAADFTHKHTAFPEKSTDSRTKKKAAKWGRRGWKEKRRGGGGGEGSQRTGEWLPLGASLFVDVMTGRLDLTRCLFS